jgi:hypothetical protein
LDQATDSHGSTRWNDAAEDLLHQILMTTPLPVRQQIANQVREIAEAIAVDEGTSRVNVNVVVAAWIKATPEALRGELAKQMERLGLDPDEYSALLME